MGQAAVDLPDPLDPTVATDDANASSATAVAAPAPAPLEGADDLLAQLAGEEIDRLLAEADAEPAPEKKRPQTDPSATATEGSGGPANLGAVLDNASKAAAEPVGPSAASVDADNLSVAERELDALLAEAYAEPSAAPAAAPAAEAPATSAPAVESPKEEQTSAVESAALLGSTAPAEQAAETSADDEPEPFLVRVLEWVNSPFAALSDGARDMVGNLAILTFFNALAVLLYVLMFRGH